MDEDDGEGDGRGFSPPRELSSSTKSTTHSPLRCFVVEEDEEEEEEELMRALVLFQL